jgi:hypothetical protein
MKKSFNQLSAIEKIAILWAAPITLVVVISISILTLLIYLFKVVVVLSGTLAAVQYLFGEVQAKVKERQFKRLRNKDKVQAKFDDLVNSKIKEKQERNK